MIHPHGESTDGLIYDYSPMGTCQYSPAPTLPPPPPLLTPHLRRGTVSMYCLIRWRSQKPVRLGDGKIAQAQSLLKTRGAEIEPHHHTLIKERLE